MDEIERLREALKTFADNVRETNAGIDENWAKTVYPLKKENQRLRENLSWAIGILEQLPVVHKNDESRGFFVESIQKLKSALKGSE